MITINNFYDVLVAVIPLYFAMLLAFLSVRHFKIFTPDQCSGINRFVAVFAVPLLSFHFISTTNPYTINLHFIFADSLQKLIILFALPFTSRILNHSFDWSITFFSLSTLPNTLVMGIPLLSAMYGSYSGQLMVQVVVLQSIVWYTLMLFLFEYRAARRLVADQFPENSASIVSFHVDNDVESLDAGQGELFVDGEVVENGKIQVVIRRSGSSSRRLSSIAGGEILSVGSSLRVSNFDEKDFGGKSELEEIQVVVAKESEVHSIQKYNGKEAEEEEKVAVELQKIGSDSKECQRMSDNEISALRMPPAKVMTRLILVMVWRKLIRNPNTYSSLIGLIWSLVAFRWHIAMPKIIEKSIAILSDAGLGMAMFSLGLFMAMQPRLIACGNRVAAFSMVIRFLMGPAVMAVASIAIGLRGTLFHIAIVQAALPQGIVPFVFAKEYNVHADVLSTGVIFGMLIALPITILYYILLGL